MKKCKYCKSEIDDKARICPVCKKKQKHTGLGILFLIIGLVLFTVVIFSDSTPAPSSSVKEIIEEANPVNMENFKKIETGMTYEEVCAIFGSEGELLSSVDIGGDAFKTEMYYWYDITHIGNCNVTFQGGGVISKAQIGLK